MCEKEEELHSDIDASSYLTFVQELASVGWPLIHPELGACAWVYHRDVRERVHEVPLVERRAFWGGVVLLHARR